MSWQRRVAFAFAAAGLVLVVATAAAWAYAFGAARLAEYWLPIVLIALIPHAVLAVAVGTVREGLSGRIVIGLAGLTVVAAGTRLFVWIAARVLDRWEFGPQYGSLEWESRIATVWLVVQGAAALVAAFASGLTWERRPRYGLWALFTLGFLGFALLVEFSVQLDQSAVFDWLAYLSDLSDNWSRWDHYVPAGTELFELARVLLPAMCLGWLAQCAAPRRRRRLPDQAADYGEQPSPGPGSQPSSHPIFR